MTGDGEPDGGDGKPGEGESPTSGWEPPEPGPDAAMAELLGALDRTLAGTAELPVDPRASTWLGEAAAVAADLAADVPADPVVRARVRTVRDLLESAGSTGNPEADERVAAALALAGRVLEE